MDALDIAVRDRLADEIIQFYAQAKTPLTLGQHDMLRQAIDAVLFCDNGLGSTMGSICRNTNPDWQEKRAEPEWCSLDDVHAMAVRAYFGEAA